MDLYKENQEDSNQLSNEKQNIQDDRYIFDPSIRILPEKTTEEKLNVDLITLFTNLNESLSLNLFEKAQIELIEIVNNLVSFQPDEKTFDFIINSNLHLQILSILQAPPTYEIYHYSIYLISSLFAISWKYEKIEIFNKFNSIENFNLLDFFIQKFNPNYKAEPTRQIDLLTFDLDMLPSYLQIISFYCIFLDKPICDMITQIVIIPNLPIFFNAFEDTELTSAASFLVSSSTKYPLNIENNEYVSWIITFTIQKVTMMDLNSQYYFFKSINNLTQNEKMISYLFNLNFETFLENYLKTNISSFTNNLLDEILTLQLKLLLADPNKVILDYSKLIDISFRFKNLRNIAFQLFGNGMKLREKDCPLDDDNFFAYFMNLYYDAAFDMKSEIVKILEVWMMKSSHQLVSKRALLLMNEISQFMEQVSINDSLFLVVLHEIIILLDIESKSSLDEFQKSKNILESNDCVSYLTELQNDEEADENTCKMAQEILKYFRSTE